MQPITVVKIGGNVIDNEAALERFLKRFASIEGPKMLIHGGGKLATRMATELKLEVKMIDGRRITDRPTLDVVTMVYAGLVNKQIVAKLQAAGCNAIGLSGADGNIVHAHRRPAKPIDYGFVGDVKEVNSQALATLIRAGVVPVIAPLTHDGKGSMLNTNADTMAGETAKGLANDFDIQLVYCFEKAGVLSNPDNDTSVIAKIIPEIYTKLKADGIISGGMIPKIDNAFAAIEHGVQSVRITHSNQIQGGTIIEQA